MSRYLILLSGGMDSVAAMHWALERKVEGRPGVRALFVDYGQPQVEAERTAAWKIAARRGVPFDVVDAMRPMLGTLGKMDPPKQGVDGRGVSLANVPGRNLLLVGCAVAEALRVWPRGGATILLGCNATDRERFQDCGAPFVEALSMATMAYNIQVLAPWADMGKADIVANFAAMTGKRGDSARADLLASSSCYLGTDCGECDACVERAKCGLHTLATLGVESFLQGLSQRASDLGTRIDSAKSSSAANSKGGA